MNLEQFLSEFFLEAARQSLDKLPVHWYGTYNAIALYCSHPHYSPFLPCPDFCTQERKDKFIRELLERGYPLPLKPQLTEEHEDE